MKVERRLVLHDVADAVSAAGVRTVYGVLGDGNLHLALALGQVGVEWVSARHEQEAVAMADGAARRTGDLTAASVTHGPGLTNAMTALTAAALAGSPVLLLLGDTPRTTRHHGQDVPQEPFVRAAGALWVPVRLPQTVAEDVAVAARAARTRRLPAVLNLPVDLQNSPPGGVAGRAFGGPAVAELPVVAPPREPSAAEVERLAERLAKARRPLVLAGRGALAAAADLVAVAALGGAWLGTTLLAKDLFRGRPGDLGVVGGFASAEARAALVDVDLVLAFGASLNRFTTANGTVCPHARWVQVERDPTAVGHTTVPDDAVLADAGRTAAALVAQLRSGAEGVVPPPAVPVPGTPPGRRTGRPPSGIDPRVVLRAADRALPARRGLVVGIGHYSGFGALGVTVADPRDLVLPWQLGSVGLALPVGLGVAHVRPTQPTLVVEGDGGVLMNPGGLDTLARLGLPVLVLVLDDGAYAAEAHLLRRTGHDDTPALFPRRDLAALARSLGLRAATARTEEELAAALDTLLPLDAPALLHAHTDLEVVHEEVFTALSG
ncbi:thiamine pyrophosphate-binding protein [Asanoa sp. NPDC050611]|uniref:thiamine pyrophosphate-binding protein n=1 Tax=Asanoa sp. NPDC050611 TaxID=3157098 RepID=UPI0033DC481C